MSTNLAAQESMNFDMPPHFYEDYEYLCEELKILFDDIKDRHIHPTLDSVTEHFIQLYESFSSEKQVFDSLNACKYSNDPIYEHSINVAILSRMLGDLNYMYSDDLNALTQAALLHDIGKLLVDPDILYKTEKLTTHEFNLIKKHTKLGYQLLNDQFTDYRIPAVALMHHERCDGSGYPMGVTAENINEFCRILSICDVYAGMVASRDYRKSCCPFQIISLFEKDGLHKYDTDFTILFLRSMLDTYIGYSVMLNTGECGIITAVNSHNLTNPVIKIGEDTVNLEFDDKRHILHII